MTKRLRGPERVAFLAFLILAPLPALGEPQGTATDSEVTDPDVGKAASTRSIDPNSWIDHDGYPLVGQPVEEELSLYAYYFRYVIVRPMSSFLDIPGKILGLVSLFGVDTGYESVNVNAFDEVANSTWFTNRNHVKAVPLDEIRRGPEHDLQPGIPWTITSTKKEGVNPGFQIKDSNGKRWVIKLDPPGYPQIGSGADVVASRLLIAAGYNLPHDVAVTFRRENLQIDEELAAGKDGDLPFTDEDLDKLLDGGHRAEDGRYFAGASLFLPGEPIGPIDFREKRRDDPNDWYTHRRRRELRGLYVIASWLNHWDTKDQQSLDMFVKEADSLGYVRHYLLDVGATLGASAEGPKRLQNGYEHAVDFGWMGRRIVGLGFRVEPWRRAKQETGIPSVGNFESVEFHPDDFRTSIPHPAFGERRDGDCYWGAKIVASFSNDQIKAAIEAAGYEDPRAQEYLLKTLIERRDKIARYWFGRVAPLDFFHIDQGRLLFHDLAMDLGIEAPRQYEVRIESPDGGAVAADHLELVAPELWLENLKAGGEHLRLTFTLVGNKARPTTVELMKKDGQWLVARVHHG